MPALATVKDGFRSAATAGATEALGLWGRSRTFGARETAAHELARERDYVKGADGLGETVLRASQSGSQLVGVMLTITIAAAVGFVGTRIGSELEDSLTDKDLSKTTAENQTIYENSTESIGSGFADAMGLTDIVFLVLMFTVIIGALLAFRGSR